MTIPELIEWLKIDEDRQIICDSIEQRFQVVKMLVENGFPTDEYTQSILDGSENTEDMHPYVWKNSEDDEYYIDCYRSIWVYNEKIYFSEIEFESSLNISNLNIDLSEFV